MGMKTGAREVKKKKSDDEKNGRRIRKKST